MYCIKCGAQQTTGAQFCAACGERYKSNAFSKTIDDEATILARQQFQSEAPEQIIFSVRPTLLFIKIGYLAALIGAAFLAGVMLFIGSTFNFAILLWLAVPLALLLLLIPAYYHFRRNLVRYTLTDSKLEIDTGFFNRRTQIVALSKIQDVTISANFWQRIFGYGSLLVDNATESAAQIVLRNINDPRGHANSLLRQMRQLKS